MSCMLCDKETDEKYIIDAAGNQYCSEDCLDQHMDEEDYSFSAHPYEDTYLMLRNEYIYLLDNWNDNLNKTTSNLEDAVDELCDDIDDLIDDYADFICAEGADGPYAWEIYQYTLKLREFQKRIFAWRPNRQTLYWLTGDSGNYDEMGRSTEECYEKISTYLYLEGYEDFLRYLIKHHQQPYHWGLNYVFDNLEMAQEAYEILMPVCKKNGVDITIVKSHKCEAHCGDILEAEADTYVNGWFYCYSCKESEDHGIFTQTELDRYTHYYADNEEARQLLIYERQDWCLPFKRRIKRSCRALRSEFPEWAN